MIQVHSGICRWVGEPDYSRLQNGYAPGGPQDRFSCRMANKLLGNDPLAGAIEFTLVPIALAVDRDCRLIVGGADCEILIDGHKQPEWSVLTVRAGATVRIKIGQAGCRVYVCVAGGLNSDLTPIGDVLNAEVGRTRKVSKFQWEPKLGTVRAIAGPEANDASIEQLVKQHWEISPQSSAMGVRLKGDPLPLESFDIGSSPVQDGTVQATAGGLIGLLRERGTLGGYPRVATVIDCDVDRLAQFQPGSRLRFEIVGSERARELCRLQESEEDWF